MKNIAVIYHKNCRDGVASAWVCYQKFAENAEYIAADDRKQLPDFVTNHNNVSELEVYIVDFCYPKEILLTLEAKCKKLVVLDHHISQKEDIESVKEHVYGTDKSGCMLAWEYFYRGQTAPLAIQYVSDSDTWEHKMPDYQYIDAYIYKDDSELNIQSFDKVVKELEDPTRFEYIKNIGKVLREVREGMINKYIERATLVNVFGYEVYAVNAPSEIKSELGHELAKKTGTFAVVYYYYEGKWRLSLRSIDDFDVSTIAAAHGGGGHKNAAAIHIACEDPLLKILNN